MFGVEEASRARLTALIIRAEDPPYLKRGSNV